HRVADGLDLPPPRHRPDLAVHEVVVAVEVDEPRLEDGLGHLLQRPVHLAVELDLVVERAEDGGYTALLVEGRKSDGQLLEAGLLQDRRSGPTRTQAEDLI